MQYMQYMQDAKDGSVRQNAVKQAVKQNGHIFFSTFSTHPSNPLNEGAKTSSPFTTPSFT